MIKILKNIQGYFKTYIIKRRCYTLVIRIITTLLFFTFLTDLIIISNRMPVCAGLFINEFMADNESTINDPDDPNSFEDWIEIYNSGNTAVAMGGMYLTDNLADPTQWCIPLGVTIPAQGYLLFWADNDEEQGITHTNFKFAVEGEDIGLFAKDGSTLVDSVTFDAQIFDVSYGRYPDGTDNWGFMMATPGTSNSQHNAPPVITGMTRIPVTPPAGAPVWVTCMVTDDNSALVSVTLTYNAGSGLIKITPQDDGIHNDGVAGDGIFGIQIPAFGKDTVVNYYITAKDNRGAQSSDPAGAPAVVYCYIVGYISPPLFINEFMADNDSTINDPDDPNSFEDWIEIYNAGAATVDMGGMYLTDNLTNPKQWQIPAGMTIPAGGYLLFWADNEEEQGPTHTNFALALAGEKIGLFAPDGITMIDSVTFSAQFLDISYGKYPDGTDGRGFMAATPGASNSQHNAPPVITGTTRAPFSPPAGEPVWVTCIVTDDDSVLASVTLTYNAGNGLNNITMRYYGTNNDAGSSDSLFGAHLPGFDKDTVVNYYLTASDNLGLQFKDPVGAPTYVYTYIVGYIPPQLFINEFMADNESTIKDPDDPNSYEDWIEIYNAGSSAVDIGEMYLTDNLANPVKWQIPLGVGIPAGGYLLFWADNNEDQGATHTSFKLNKEGGQIGLFDSDAKKNMRIDSMTFGEQPKDTSCGRIYDGDDPWSFSKNATPGYTNTFPPGRCTMIWTLPYSIDSHVLIKNMGGCVHAINRLHPVSDRQESRYLFWGRASGQNFSIKTGDNYDLSITSYCNVSFSEK